MTLPQVSIHTTVQGCCGRRALNAHEELAARTFAAQPHLRLRWLQQARDDSDDPRP
ncbi:hypothetical protein ACSX1C_05550 [Pseudomonas sp. MBLB4123]|uniref:hypothetical protein n=1 Tax=Pseudomonas sp. MBLB4123 TaxID=3451557 RepID=UPI003F75308D